jgi:DNA-binding Xre family transcriptional regulator
MQKATDLHNFSDGQLARVDGVMKRQIGGFGNTVDRVAGRADRGADTPGDLLGGASSVHMDKLAARTDSHKHICLRLVCAALRMPRTFVHVETKGSKINRAIARQIRAEKAGADPEPSVDDLVAATGLSSSTINRMLSKNPRDINVTQLTRISFALGLTPDVLLDRAIARAGGIDNLLSDGPDTTDDLDTKRKQKAAAMTPEQIENRDDHALAATQDDELDTDEPEAP